MTYPVIPDPVYSVGSPHYFVVTDYGAVGNGVTDSTAFIQNAITAALNAGGGIVLFPPGTYISGNQTLASNVYLQGADIGATVIKLKNSANTDLFSANTANINLSGAVGAGSATGVISAGICNITLDGNKANQSSGMSYPIRGYGYNLALQNIEIKNGYTGGILWDWNNTADPASPNISIINHWDNIECHDNNGIGIQVGGPTDAQWKSVNSYKNGSHGYHFAPNAVGIVLSQCHGWEPATGVNAVTALVEGGGNKFINCQMEGSDTCQLAILANDTEFVSGEIFIPTGVSPNTTGVGVQLGQTSGHIAIPHQINQSGGNTTAVLVSGSYLHTKIDNCGGGAIDYQNEHNTNANLLIWTNGAGVLVSGRTPNYLDKIIHDVSGITSDGSMNTSSLFSFGGAGFNMFRILGSDGTPMMNCDGTDNTNTYANGTKLVGYSDYFSTEKWELQSTTGNMALWGWMKVQNSSTFYSGSGAPSNGNGSNGDYYFRTDTPGTANQRIYVKSSGSWVGIV